MDKIYLIGMAIGGAYLMNIGGGFIGEIPDNLPFIGNLDEGAAMLLVMSCFKRYVALQKGEKVEGSVFDDIKRPKNT